MAVKQNNTEPNGGGTTGNNSASGTGANAKSNGGAAASGGGTKAKKLNPNLVGAGAGGFVDSDADGAGSVPPGCSGDTNAMKSQQVLGLGTSQSNIGGVSGGGGGVGAGSNVPVAPKQDLTQILALIERLVELKNQKLYSGHDILKIYKFIIMQLSRVPIPRPPEELKRFKEDINKVGEFFRKSKEESVYFIYLHFVCQHITNNEETPTCAIAIIFELFNEDMVYEAVQSLLSRKIPDKNIQKTVRLLSEWLRMCNFCQNLNLWILAILKGLQEQQKYELFYFIALENVEQLFSLLIVPVLRPKVAPIVLYMLASVNHTPHVFHKILPKFPRDISALKQQSLSLEKYADDTKKFLQQLVDLTSALMVRFHGYDELYKPIEHVLKDFQPSYNYLNYAPANKNHQDDNLDNALIQNNNNAKVGLVNLGNTCYMNSVLQALAMTKEFSREILLTESTSPLLIKIQQQIALMLYSIRYELTPSRVLNATRPPGFSPGLQQDSSEFLGYLLETLHEQEVTFRKKSSSALSSIVVVSSNSDTDSEPIAKTSKQMEIVVEQNTNIAIEEGASAMAFNNTPLSISNNLINTTDTSENHNTRVNIISRSCPNTAPSTTIITTTTATTTTAANTTKTTLTTTVKMANGINNCAALVAVQSTIEKTFTGKLATTYKCLTCGWKSRNIDSFRDLQLSFPEVKNDCASNYSVQDLIDYYCSPEKLYGDNQYFCEKCKKLSDAERFINVISAPKNLILTLKHFKYDQKYHMRAKLMHKVFHDEKVSVKICSADSLEEIASVHYDLYAGVVHSGFSMDSGHYYTYASDSGNKWYKFNDSVVTPSKSEELHNLTPPNTPYILFYQMGARSNETPEASPSTSKVIKVDVPTPLMLEELPRELRDYVNRDNCAFNEELKSRRLKLANTALQNAAKAKGNGPHGPRGDHYDDDDEDQPPPASGCGGNAMNINVNRFVY